MTDRITGISSMATRQVLADLAAAYLQCSGVEVSFESVGGVDAAKRLQAGEPFDVVVLAADAIDKLVAAGCVVADSKTDLMRSAVAIAVRAGGNVSAAARSLDMSRPQFEYRSRKHNLLP